MYDFNHIERLKLDKEKRIDRSFVKCGDLKFCVYCIVIDNDLVYIGKARDMWKRLDTYRNSKYWKVANPSNILKTCRLEMAIRKRKCVELRIITSNENDYHQLEVDMIRTHNPEWNHKLCLKH